MDPLLGVARHDDRLAKDEVSQRLETASTRTELEEEELWDAGLGRNGTFGQPISTESRKEIPRVAFEWRAEDEVVDAEASKTSDVAFPTPTKAARKMRKESHGVHPTSTWATGATQTSYRFIDVSARGIPQEAAVQKEMRHRKQASERNKKRRALPKL